MVEEIMLFDNKNVSPDELVQIANNQAVTTSLNVAEHFGKQHKHVIEAIEKLVAGNSAAKSMFCESTHENRGKEYKMYLMNRNGFTILVMGFTGKKALDWKLRYIEAFNQMEKRLAEPKRDSYMIENPIERAQRWIEEEQVRQRLETKVHELTPKAESFDRVCNGKNYCTFTEASKILGIRRKDLINALTRHHYIYRDKHVHIHAYSTHTQNGDGVFVAKRVPSGDPYRNERGKMCCNTYPQTYLTVKGMHIIREKLKQWGLIKKSKGQKVA